MTTAEKIREILLAELLVDEDELTDDAHLVNDLGADSLDVVEVIMALEEQFWIEISDVTASRLTTVGKIISYVERAVAMKGK